MKFSNLCFLVCLTGFLLFSCETTPSSTPGNSTANGQVTDPPVTTSPANTTTAAKEDLADLEQKGQVMSTSAFNNEVATARENGESWTSSPLTVALRFAGEGFDCRKKNVSVESLSGGEVFDKVLVSITEDGFLDDSIRGSKVILRMEQTNGFWKISSAKKVWKCWENRGHTAFNSDPCH